MTKKEKFIEEIKDNIDNGNIVLSDEANDFFNDLTTNKIGKVGGITENGLKILNFMTENVDKYNNIFKAKEIAEGLFTSARSVSSSMRKLISEEYCEKVSAEPVQYGLTEKGKEFSSIDK